MRLNLSGLLLKFDLLNLGSYCSLFLEGFLLYDMTVFNKLFDEIWEHGSLKKTTSGNYHIFQEMTDIPLPQYLLLTTMLMLNGVCLSLELMESSGTGWRKSYGWRINSDKLNNCTVVGGATRAEHKQRTDSVPYGHQHNIMLSEAASCFSYCITLHYIFIYIWLYLMGPPMYWCLHVGGV